MNTFFDIINLYNIFPKELIFIQRIINYINGQLVSLQICNIEKKKKKKD